MTDNRAAPDYDESEDLLMNDDADFLDDDVDEEQEVRTPRTRAFNLDMRHRIEDRLEQRRLLKEINEYEFFNLDEDSTLH